jgi:hypothetical protein
VDIYASNKRERIENEVKEICSTVLGLRVASDFNSGKTLVSEKSIVQNAELLQSVMEVGRRHKIRNPDKMRSQYGKIIHMLQDSHETSYKLVKPVVTVRSFLSSYCNGQLLLSHPLLAIATAEVRTDIPREVIDKAVAAKKRALDTIVRDCIASMVSPAPMSSSEKAMADDDDEDLGTSAAAADRVSNQAQLPLKMDDVHRCVASIFDNHSFLLSNRGPVDAMITYLKDNFDPVVPGKFPLQIQYGRNGSCLSHDHGMQYTFVMQSLILWKNILHDMFRLWSLSEQDLLDPGLHYALRNTGQGLQRMQSCPKISAAMSKIVGGTHQSTRAKFGGWVGLSVVHLGDRDVPNALIFIDKYNQVSRILAPIISTLKDLGPLYESNIPLKRVIDNFWGGLENARLDILSDFFKHGFDGSGDDGGSCIDGRLTSCWNWCSKIAKKRYYILFQLTGFVGFDGEF